MKLVNPKINPMERLGSAHHYTTHSDHENKNIPVDACYIQNKHRKLYSQITKEAKLTAHHGLQ